MGVLDDAIREHLELRRSHGAPEAELDRKQAEALGPARREVTPPKRAAPPESAGPAAAPEPSTAADSDANAGPLEGSDLSETELLGPDDAELHERFDPERLRRSAAADVEEERSATVHDDLLASDEELIEDRPLAKPGAMSAEEEEAEYGAEGAPPSRFGPAFEEDEPATVERDALEDEDGRVEDATPSVRDEEELGPAEDSEDVLEDTPDFLQETPEHDRLWFEQKPPRDFDLDDK